MTSTILQRLVEALGPAENHDDAALSELAAMLMERRDRLTLEQRAVYERVLETFSRAQEDARPDADMADVFARRVVLGDVVH